MQFGDVSIIEALTDYLAQQRMNTNHDPARAQHTSKLTEWALRL
jgi:hypothetical protein